eukprot:m.207880 g.207880  ORF g.207880 m.207880 type:complete len:92 (+) comp39699_c0_seq1:1390-1665(+)
MCFQLESQSYRYSVHRDKRGRTRWDKSGDGNDAVLYGGGRAGAAKDAGGWSDTEDIDDDQDGKPELRSLIERQFQLRKKVLRFSEDICSDD